MTTYNYNTGKPLAPGEPQAVFNSQTGQRIGAATSVPVTPGNFLPLNSTGYYMTPEQQAQYNKSTPQIGGINGVNADGTPTPDANIKPSDPITAGTITTQPQTTQYTIKPGDTLSTIAAANGTNLQAILSANPNIKNPSKISSGSVITIPAQKQGNMVAPGDKSNQTQNAIYSRVQGVSDLNNSGDVRAAGNSALTQVNTPQSSDPVTTAINTTTEQLLSDINQKNNTEATISTVSQYMLDESNALGIPQMKTDLMNIQNVINGSEQDIRNEITTAGGTATESQVEALTSARNKTLLLKASNIQNALSNAQDTLSMDVNAYSADRTNALNALSDKISGDQTALALFQNIQTQASANYGKIVTNVGYTGLAATLNGDPQSLAIAEKSLGLPAGTLSDPVKLKNLETFRQQSLSMSQQRLNVTISNSGAAGGSVNDMAMAVLNGQLAPSQIPGYGKNSLRSQVESAVLTANPSFDFEKADQQFAFGKNQQTQTTEASLNYTIDTLNQLKTLSTKVDRGNITFGNQAGQWLQYNGSDKATVAFVTKVNGAIDDVAAALGGGVSTDAKLSIAKKLLDPTLSNDAFNTQVDTDLTTVYSRLNAIQGQAGQQTTPNPNVGGVTIGGTVYPAGQIVGTVQNDKGQSVTLTAQDDGNLKGSDGKIYDINGNEIK